MCEGKETCPSTGKPIAEAPCNKLSDKVSDQVSKLTLNSQSDFQRGQTRSVGNLFKLVTEDNVMKDTKS